MSAVRLAGGPVHLRGGAGGDGGVRAEPRPAAVVVRGGGGDDNPGWRRKCHHFEHCVALALLLLPRRPRRRAAHRAAAGRNRRRGGPREHAIGVAAAAAAAVPACVVDGFGERGSALRPRRRDTKQSLLRLCCRCAWCCGVDRGQALRETLAVTLQGLPPNLHVGLVTFGAAVHVYDLAAPRAGVASCEVLPGDRHVSAARLQPLVYGAPAARPAPACFSVLAGSPWE
eukprot:scaffold3218_cov350-Prasinococcus_capsulatus_cf.AAC.12